MAEIQSIYFDPGEIRTALDRNLAEGLRMLADAIERKHLDGRLIDAMGVAGGRNDHRAHVLVQLDIAGPVVVSREAPTVRKIESGSEVERVG